MEARLLLWIHAHAHPWLDALFVVSHSLATVRAGGALVLAAMAWHWWRRERRAAGVWLVLGLVTLFAQWALKDVFDRARPDLWPRLVEAGGASLPSGHALASAALYPALAAVLARRHAGGARVYFVLGLVLPAFIGFGRLYLGVHWPSDVAVGWVLGAGLAACAIPRLRAGMRL